MENKSTAVALASVTTWSCMGRGMSSTEFHALVRVDGK